VRDESNIPLLEQTKAKVRNCSFSINRGGKEREIEIASDDVCFFSRCVCGVTTKIARRRYNKSYSFLMSRLLQPLLVF
jgi:hypothetical protein